MEMVTSAGRKQLQNMNTGDENSFNTDIRVEKAPQVDFMCVDHVMCKPAGSHVKLEFTDAVGNMMIKLLSRLKCSPRVQHQAAQMIHRY